MGKRVMCEATNPDNGDQCQCLVGHGGSHRATRMWDTPYRMAEPKNVGAAVIDAGLFVWRLSSEARWRADEGMAWCQWADITDPEPFQNCTLTANDLEPPEGSLILDSQRLAHQRHDEYWYGPADSHADKMDVRWWSQLDFPVTLLYRGEA